MSQTYFQLKNHLDNQNRVYVEHHAHREDEFRFRGKYHSSNPLVWHRNAGYHPFTPPPNLPLVLSTDPELCFQSSPITKASCIHSYDGKIVYAP